MSNKTGLVLDGGEVKFRLQAERKALSTLVHVDWLRFTVLLRNAVPTFEPLPVTFGVGGFSYEKWLATLNMDSLQFAELPAKQKEIVIKSTIDGFEAEHREPVFRHACNAAFDMAREVAAILGPDFTVNTVLKPGQDFYKHRISIDRAGHECAWVGFLAAGNGKAKGSQDNTLHVNVQGHACTFAQLGWAKKMADCIDLHKAKITRADLALDMFDGLGYDFARLVDDYKNDLFNVRGKRPAYDQAGDWGNDNSRSVYIGSRTSGKVTNIYEKGDQLFGPKAGSPWVRAELRYGNQERVLPSDLLRSPDSFFSGASDWHEALLFQAGTSPVAQPIKTTPALDLQTVQAEVSRNLRWLRDSAAPTFRAALKYINFDTLLTLLNPENEKVPGRLGKFKPSELQGAFDAIAHIVSPRLEAPPQASPWPSNQAVNQGT